VLGWLAPPYQKSGGKLDSDFTSEERDGRLVTQQFAPVNLKGDRLAGNFLSILIELYKQENNWLTSCKL